MCIKVGLFWTNRMDLFRHSRGPFWFWAVLVICHWFDSSVTILNHLILNKKSWSLCWSWV